MEHDTRTCARPDGGAPAQWRRAGRHGGVSSPHAFDVRFWCSSLTLTASLLGSSARSASSRLEAFTGDSDASLVRSRVRRAERERADDTWPHCGSRFNTASASAPGSSALSHCAAAGPGPSTPGDGSAAASPAAARSTQSRAGVGDARREGRELDGRAAHAGACVTPQGVRGRGRAGCNAKGTECMGVLGQIHGVSGRGDAGKQGAEQKAAGAVSAQTGHAQGHWGTHLARRGATASDT